MKLEDLEIYRLANELSDLAWDVVEEWEWYHQNAFGWQMVRSADSVSANVAEAHGRFTFKDRRRFIRIARGSLFEFDSWLRKAEKRRLIDQERLDTARRLTKKLHWKINRYIQHLSKMIAQSRSYEAENRGVPAIVKRTGPSNHAAEGGNHGEHTKWASQSREPDKVERAPKPSHSAS